MIKTAFATLVWQCGKAGLRVGLVLEPPIAALGTKERARQAKLQILVYRFSSGVREVGWCSPWVEAGGQLEHAATDLLTTLAGKGLIA